MHPFNGYLTLDCKLMHFLMNRIFHNEPLKILHEQRTTIVGDLDLTQHYLLSGISNKDCFCKLISSFTVGLSDSPYDYMYVFWSTSVAKGPVTCNMNTNNFCIFWSTSVAKGLVTCNQYQQLLYTCSQKSTCTHKTVPAVYTLC